MKDEKATGKKLWLTFAGSVLFFFWVLFASRGIASWLKHKRDKLVLTNQAAKE